MGCIQAGSVRWQAHHLGELALLNIDPFTVQAQKIDF